MTLAKSNGKTLALWLIGMLVQVSFCNRSFADGDEPTSPQVTTEVAAEHDTVENAETDPDWDSSFELYFALVLPPDLAEIKQLAVRPGELKMLPPVPETPEASPALTSAAVISKTPPDNQWTPAPAERPGLVDRNRNVAAINFLRDDPPLPPGMTNASPIADASEEASPRPIANAIDKLQPVVVNHPVPMQPTEMFRRNGYLPGCMDVEGSGWPCATCGQCACSCNAGVTWVFGADAVFLQRSEADGFSQALISSGTFSTQSDDLTFDYMGGPRFRVMRDQNAGLDFEAIYYQVDEWSDDSFLSGPVFALGVDIGNGSASARYTSEFKNFEANVLHDWTNWTKLLFGFRWLRLDEFASVAASGTNVANFDRRVDTSNDLYGGQIGLQHTFWDRGGQLTVEGAIKAGIYNNSIDRASVGFGPASLGDDATSFVGELDIALNYELTTHWSATAGYQAIWITEVAQAVDQLFSPTQVFHDETAILNGFRAGLTFAW